MAKIFRTSNVVDLTTVSQNVVLAGATNPAILHSFSVGNVDGVNQATFDLEFFDDSATTTTLFAKGIPVAGGGAFSFGSVFNLEINDAWKALASVNGDLSFLGSYIERSNPTGKTFKNTGVIPLTTTSQVVLSAPSLNPAVLYSLAVGNVDGVNDATFDLEFVDTSATVTKTFIKGINVPAGSIFSFDEAVTLEKTDQLKAFASANSRLAFFGSYMEVANT